jgi:hypothetical protein
MNPDDTSVYVTSIYGAQLRRPLVQIRQGDRAPFSIAPAEARALAANLLAGAEAAESDAFLFEFMAQKVGIPEREAGAMLVAFRQWREEHSP